jgi:hypothetical protein
MAARGHLGKKCCLELSSVLRSSVVSLLMREARARRAKKRLPARDFGLQGLLSFPSKDNLHVPHSPNNHITPRTKSNPHPTRLISVAIARIAPRR